MSAYSNDFTATPLTADSLQQAVAQMCDSADGMLGIRPDTIILPPGLIENAIYAGRVAIERLVRLLSRPVKCGHYAQRQRRRAQGIDARREQKRLRFERRLVDDLNFLEVFEGLDKDDVKSS